MSVSGGERDERSTTYDVVVVPDDNTSVVSGTSLRQQISSGSQVQSGGSAETELAARPVSGGRSRKSR